MDPVTNNPGEAEAVVKWEAYAKLEAELEQSKVRNLTLSTFLDAAESLYQENLNELADENARLAKLEMEVERLKRFHIEDMRVTNESATFHMQRCSALTQQLAAAQLAIGVKNKVIGSILRRFTEHHLNYALDFETVDALKSAYVEEHLMKP